MALTHRTATTHTSSTSDPVTLSVTIAENDVAVILMLSTVLGAARAGADPKMLGHNGPLTEPFANQVSVERDTEIWVLLNIPPPGTYTISIGNTNLDTVWHAAAIAKGKSRSGCASIRASNG